MVEEGSGGQPLYLVEILHDEQGKSYLVDGWTRFIDDYDLKCGWSLIFTRRAESPVLYVRVVDTSGCACLLPLAVSGEHPQSPFLDDGFVNGES
jgi:hypothetical protein